MQTRAEIETELIARLMVANNSTLISPARATTLVKDASNWAGTMFFWPALYRSRKFSTKPNTQSLNYDYYDYPTDMLQDSASRLYINGVKYEKKDFQDFLDYVDNPTQYGTPPATNKYIFAEFARQFFVYPKVSVAGSNDGLIWGNIQPAELVNPTDRTIFSLWNDTGNEAILKKAMSVAMERLDSGFAQQQLAEAAQLLTVIWKKVTTEKQRSQRIDHPFFKVPDLYSGGVTTSPVGNFSIVDR